MAKYQRPSDVYFDNARLTTLVDLACDDLDVLLQALDVDVRKYGRKFSGPCPVHGGDNPGALNLFPDGHTVRGTWRCHTRRCEGFFKPTLLGFVRGVLSHQQFNWDGVGEKRTVTFANAVDYVAKHLKVDFRNMKVDRDEIEKRKFCNQALAYARAKEAEVKGWPRADVRAKLAIPSPYFLSRGYSPEILDQYDVGEPLEQKGPLAGRVVIPVFDPDYKKVIGFSGRSLYAKCETCDSFHRPGCCEDATKWHHHGFEAGSSLYNFWFAKKPIIESSVAVLCEGPGDVWRLVEAGVHNAVALFGNALTDEQQIILETSGAMSVALLLDKDAAGRAGEARITQQLRRSYHIVAIEIAAKDVGEMTADCVRNEIKPQLEVLCKRYRGL